MYLTIPANTTMERYGDALPALMDWLRANGVDPGEVSGIRELNIGSHKISGHYRTTGLLFEVKTQLPMPEDLLGYLAARFGCVYGEGEVAPMIPSEHRLQPDEKAAPLDDIESLYKQLGEARVAEKAAKERAEEARDQILARLKAAGKEYGTVAGQRVVHWKVVEKSQFKIDAFRKDHPDLAGKYTGKRSENRLELL